MKIYVAGISVSPDHIEKTIEEKTKLIIDLLKTIHREALNTLGDDAIIMVLMPEYALTPTAISEAESMLRQLYKAFLTEVGNICTRGSDDRVSGFVMHISFSARDNFLIILSIFIENDLSPLIFQHCAILRGLKLRVYLHLLVPSR